MSAKATVRQVPFGPGRVLAVSDVHGNLPMLRGALAAAGFTQSDTLVIVGDLVEKGPDSLGTLRYVMELSRRQRVYCVRGNCDDLVVEFADGTWSGSPAFYRQYLRTWGERCLLLQMGRLAGLTCRGEEDMPALRRAVCRNFAPELDFLRAMPVILEMPQYLFVHGGVPGEEGLEELDAWQCMKNDGFLHRAGVFRRWCVVGHWPVMLYRTDLPCAAPIADAGRRILSLDGGCSLTPDGQLNVAILPRRPEGEIPWVGYDRLPLVTALDAQRPSGESVNVCFGRHQVEVLSRNGEFARCRHLESGRELDILSDFLYEADGATYTQDATDYRLAVEPGDTLSLVRRVRGGCLAKKSSVTGWYFGRFRENQA